MSASRSTNGRSCSSGRQEIGQFQSRKAQSCIDEALLPLAAENKPAPWFVQAGGIVFDSGHCEELECDEIVLPCEKKDGRGSLATRLFRTYAASVVSPS